MSDEKQPLLCQKIVYYNGSESTSYQYGRWGFDNVDWFDDIVI